MSNRRVLRRIARPFSPREREADTNAAGLRFVVLCSRWNPEITQALLRHALCALEAHGVREHDVEIMRVPGAFELPAAAALAAAGPSPPDAIVALGAVVRGETTHHEVLGHAVATALAALSAQTCPIGFGLLTCDSIEQARARTAKGSEAAEAAIEMANLCRQSRRPSGPKATESRANPRPGRAGGPGRAIRSHRPGRP